MNKLKILIFGFAFFAFSFTLLFAQDSEIKLTLDAASPTIPLPKIFKPNIDLSGRGFNRTSSWPQSLADEKILEKWKNDIGFSGIYRIQYNLWEINQLAKDKESQNKLLYNYEKVIKNISDAGGTVILDIFGTPAGLGEVLDKKSPPWDLKAFKELVKNHIRDLSCQKKYNIWYEVWSAPDLDGFFLGRKQEYLNLYRQVAEAVKELEAEAKIHIPVGGPSVSWWFQNPDGNNIMTVEKSLIYELMKFCYSYRLPLDFISWHSYSTNSGAEGEITKYKKTAVKLVRDWLTDYFHFDKNTPLIVDEWNYDSGMNMLPERYENSFVCASYIPSRIKKMYEAGLDYQVYFCLEDFYNKKEGVTRNVGAFWLDPEASEYKGEPKSIYNVFRMLNHLGNNMLSPVSKIDDEFLSMVATKTEDGAVIIISNYIDPDIAKNYISKNIATLNDRERKLLMSLIRANKLEKIIARQIDVSSLRLSAKLKALLKKALELNDLANKFKSSNRNIRLEIKNFPGYYSYQKYTLDYSCSTNCAFVPSEEKKIDVTDTYGEGPLSISPYSVNMIILKKEIKEADKTASEPQAEEKVSDSTK
ncbi:MAG: hypothetical protein PHQ57_06325 [Candidatus Omnitrophica bacterium]|nr:hypothetical protein [Candidatus Omnitrophota bacterium]